jgi:DUF4097 and DUF4098 domain-containing protein YvlB
MDNQEMQFADPAWRPPHERESNAPVQNQQLDVPQPINKSPHNEVQWEAAPTQQPYMDTPYADYRGYQVSPLQSSPAYARPQQRKQRTPFIWLIAAFIIIMMMGNAFSRMSFSNSIPDFRYHIHHKPYIQPQQFTVGDHPTVVINDPYGSVRIHAGGPADLVSIQTNQEERGDVAPLISQSDKSTLTISVDSAGNAEEVDLDVTVANEANITVHTNGGDIEVDNVNGQLSLTSDSGSINASQVMLEGKSTLQNNSGSILFDGTLAPESTSRFQANSGSIDVTLPQDASFHGDVITNSRSFNSDFPEVRIQPPDTHEAHGNVGNDARTTVSITSDSGSIDLHKGL